MKEPAASSNRTYPMRVLLATAALALCASAVVVLAAFGRWSLRCSPWFIAAIRSRLFIMSAIICVVGAVLLSVLAAMLWQVGAPQRHQRREGQAGGVVVEFALAIPIATMIVLIMVQAALLMGGNLCVHYAAYCAARSAIVTVPLNYGEYEPHNVVDVADTSAKLWRIKSAAAWAVVPVSCNSYGSEVGTASVEQGLAEMFSHYGEEAPGWTQHLGQRLAYAQDYTTVTLTSPADHNGYAENEDLVVHVRHTLYLSVPYGAAIFAGLSGDGRQLDFGTNEYGMDIYATCRLTNEGVRDYVNVETVDE